MALLLDGAVEVSEVIGLPAEDVWGKLARDD
jgi:hypothetical protein